MKKKRPIERTPSLKRDASLIVIASEDRYAVKQYFELFRSTRIQFKVLETDDCRSSPAHVMERLDQFKDDFEIGEGDELWLVCDTDRWIEYNNIQSLTKVIQLCKQKRIRVSLSNPCFDLWLLLHFSELPTEEYLSCNQVGSMLRIIVNGYNKTKIYNLPIKHENVLRAIQRAKVSYPNSGEIPNKPGTRIYQIIENLVEHGYITLSK